MKILVSNDDGIDALGIEVLAEQLKQIGEVTVVAPFKEQSAVGHAITMKVPLRIIKYYKNGNFFGYAVDGSPADCVKMGVRNILHFRPDIVVSGINHGSNTATNVIYSGTVSAAREATIMDIPAIAISLTSHTGRDFKFAAKVAAYFTKKIAEQPLAPGTLLNINVPDVPENEIQGIQITRQGRSKWDDCYEKREDPYGRDYYWLTGNLIQLDSTLEYDQFAILNKYVSVTPIHFDMTDLDSYSKMQEWTIDQSIIGEKE